MLPIMFTAIIACAATAAMTAPYSQLLALLVGPILGSFAGLCVALFQAWQRGPEWSAEKDLDRQTDAMVSALRQLAEQGSAIDTASSAKHSKSLQAITEPNSTSSGTMPKRAAG